MNCLIFLGHPAHYHLFKNIIIELKKNGNTVKVLSRTKDILEELCLKDNIEFLNVLPEVRKKSVTSIVISYLRKYKRISRIIKDFKPDLLLGSEPSLTHLGKFYRIPSFVFSEDDVSIIPQFAKIAYPFVSVILSPQSCNAGKWEFKKVGYNGFHKLAYLHPLAFKAQVEEIGELANRDYFILRFAELVAYHDTNKSGITNEIARRLIAILEPYGNVFITSERPLAPEFEKYKLTANPSKIHHILAYAKMYIGDSQSMAVEAALLGTPGIRFNDFAGEIGVLNELEYNYKLTSSFKTNEVDRFFEKVNEMLMNKALNAEYKSKQTRMLGEKINVLKFFVWFIENYPKSASIMKENPDYQYNFR
ncbi:glycosyltransferase [Larkinella punicea]|uniref:DUF354 domain-containing protein n=1 Tax=Larkinella punicea TaxID=2315727 RepID=A0A368JIY1_9BACT|nr:glycosyltransferase [Larkinella punicea]RCR67608.1 DUF354 domain-containing protein [Larkinella punicea]